MDCTEISWVLDTIDLKLATAIFRTPEGPVDTTSLFIRIDWEHKTTMDTIAKNLGYEPMEEENLGGIWYQQYIKTE